jgi:mevalonate kinase
LVDKSFPAKLLLFGEYTVLLDGQALAIPYYQYRGRWVNHIRAYSQPSSFNLLAEYLDQIKSRLINKLDLGKFRDFIGDGGVFESDIPQGVGLGSSAALTASIYDLLGDHESLNLSQKQADLALIESFYHGKSSGFDALVSLVQRPIFIQTKNEMVILDKLPQQSINLYLLVTEVGRKTQNLVGWFENSFQDTFFQQTMIDLAEANNTAIQGFIEGQANLEIAKKISEIQFYSLQPLIAPSLRELWQKTLNDENLALKILGAGGGGYYLLFSKFEIVNHSIAGFQLKKVDLFTRPLKPGQGAGLS